VQVIKFQVTNQDGHPFIGPPSKTLSIIYFCLKICIFLPASTAQSMDLGEGHSKSMFCSCESQLRALHFLLFFAGLRCSLWCSNWKKKREFQWFSLHRV